MQGQQTAPIQGPKAARKGWRWTMTNQQQQRSICIVAGAREITLSEALQSTNRRADREKKTSA